jgi:N-acetyl-anhydromuramoyl-L-alanine amidase
VNRRPEIVHGRVETARQCPSPNQDSRPAECQPSLLVIHGISLPPGEFGGPWIDQLFTNCLDTNHHPFFAEIRDLRVSSHLLIRRDGQLVQYVSLDRRAWHAGRSAFMGRRACNDFAIGIELEGCDDRPYTDAQYAALSPVVAAIRAVYPAIGPHRVVGHCHIAPGRKTDPGPMFQWHRLRQGMLDWQ